MNLTEKYIYPFFESIRIVGGEIGLLEFHQRRIDHVFRHFYRDRPVLIIKTILNNLRSEDEVMKCKLSYNGTNHSIVVKQYEKRNIKKLKIIKADHLRYPFKFSDRSAFQSITTRLDANCDCILSINGRLTDTSYGNILLKKNDEWYTPLYPLFYGVQRSYVIQEGIAQTRDILTQDVYDYDGIMIINAMMPMHDAIHINVDAIQL